MPKIGFNPEPLGVATGTQYGNVGGPASGCAFVPVMGPCVGIEAIIEGLRLADIKCVPPICEGGTWFAEDIDP